MARSSEVEERAVPTPSKETQSASAARRAVRAGGHALTPRDTPAAACSPRRVTRLQVLSSPGEKSARALCGSNYGRGQRSRGAPR